MFQIQRLTLRQCVSPLYKSTIPIFFQQSIGPRQTTIARHFSLSLKNPQSLPLSNGSGNLFLKKISSPGVKSGYRNAIFASTSILYFLLFKKKSPIACESSVESPSVNNQIHAIKEGVEKIQQLDMSYIFSQMKYFSQVFVISLYELFTGAYLAVKGSLMAYSRPKVRELNYEFAKSLIQYSLKWYCYLAVAIGATFPVSLPVLLVAPSLIINLFFLVPIWAVNDVLRSNQSGDNIFEMFIEGMYTRDPELAAALKIADETNVLDKQKHPHRTIKQMIEKSYYLICGSILSWGAACIPGLGLVLGPLMEWSIVSRSLGWSLTLQYIKKSLAWNQHKRLDYIKTNVFRVIGFGAVFMLIGSIPFVGCFFISIGQAAVAHFFEEELILEGKNRFVKKDTAETIPASPSKKRD